MLDFTPVTVEDRDWMYPIIYSENIRNADYSFVNIFAWGASYAARYTCIGSGVVISTNVDGTEHYSYPLGVHSDAELKTVIDALIGHCAELGTPLLLRAIAPDKLSRLEALYPGKFEFSPVTDLFDYIYSAEKLSTLAGKKLHSKRNFINRFLAQREWYVAPIDGSNTALIADLGAEWISAQDESAYDTAFAEAMAIRSSLTHFNRLGLDGAVLYADGRPCAFTIGERLCEDTYVIHFEKADASVDGAYPMINREFVRMIREKYPEIQYINREDDMGLENLRKAKQSYYPEFMEEKYMAVMK